MGISLKIYQNQRASKMLVAKGYVQRPGYDFDQTFSLVVQLETIWAILAIVPSK